MPGTFSLVYLVANTIMNVTTQDEQLAVFANAAAHLAPGSCFVVEVIVPQLRRVPAGEAARVFTLEPDHVGIETFDDPVGRSRGPITGSPCGDAWCATQRRIGTSGRPSST